MALLGSIETAVECQGLQSRVGAELLHRHHSAVASSAGISTHPCTMARNVCASTASTGHPMEMTACVLFLGHAEALTAHFVFVTGS